ncbi:MAG: OmpA family protein, partial [Leptospirales bacterium]
NAFIRTHKIIIKSAATGYRSRVTEVPLSELIEDYSVSSGEILLPIQLVPLVDEKFDAIPPGFDLIDIVYFDTNVSVKLRESEEVKLESIAEKLINSKGKIQIHGHTDNRGSLKKNDSLSKKRALYIQKALIKAGVPEARIKVLWHNYSLPAEKGSTDKERTKNRRVEIFLEKQK